MMMMNMNKLMMSMGTCHNQVFFFFYYIKTFKKKEPNKKTDFHLVLKHVSR